MNQELLTKEIQEDIELRRSLLKEQRVLNKFVLASNVIGILFFGTLLIGIWFSRR